MKASRKLRKGGVYKFDVPGWADVILMSYLGYKQGAQFFVPLTDHPFSTSEDDGSVGFAGQGITVYIPTKSDLLTLNYDSQIETVAKLFSKQHPNDQELGAVVRVCANESKEIENEKWNHISGADPY